MNKKKTIIICLVSAVFAFFAVGCEKEQKPGNILPEDKFIEVIKDMHLADAIISEKGYKESRLDSGSYYNSVFKKHNISRREFDENLKYYANHPKQLSAMYEKVIVQLLKQQEKLESKQRELNKPEKTE